nr:FCS-Like Zinc finger 5-like [Ipomoea batatas]
MLGKQSRPPFRRTTSMTGITVDVGSGMEDVQPPAVEGQVMAVPNGGYDRRSMAMVSPRYYGGRTATTSGDCYHIETPSFLTTCSLCNRRLAPCRDIFMYRYNLSSFSLP